MPIIHIMQGLPASGKSTLARQFVQEGVIRYNLDDMRAMMGIVRDNWDKNKENIAVESMIRAASWALMCDYNVVIDNTHLVPRLPEKYKKTWGGISKEFTFRVHSFLNVPIEECIRRDAERTKGWVGEKVIRQLNDNYERAKSTGWVLTEEWMNGGN